MYFERGDSLSVFRRSQQIHEKGEDDWRWTKKAKSAETDEVEGGARAIATVVTKEEDAKDAKDAKKDWKKRPCILSGARLRLLV